MKCRESGKLLGGDELFRIMPSYSIMAYFLTKPNLDVVRDDEWLWKTYVKLHGIEKEEEFPVQMKARLTWLYNKEVSEGYEALMKKYPMA